MASESVPDSSRGHRPPAYRRWHGDDDEDQGEGTAFKPLNREEAQALRSRMPSLSPWRVIWWQCVTGLCCAVVVGLISGRAALVGSFLYGAAAVVLPGVLMARGMTSRLSRLAPAVAAVSFMAWEFAKIIVSVLMLALAPRIVPMLSWPALLAGLVICMKVYWVALLWRGSNKL